MDKIFKQLLIFVALLCALAQVAFHEVLAGEDSGVEVFAATRDDIDYTTRTLGISGAAVTRVGKFECLGAREAGETRVDSFNNIFGISSVLDARWLDYSADRLKCSYGLAAKVGDGKLTAGLGFDRYGGETELIPGGKKNELDGLGLVMGYKADGQKHELKILRKDYYNLSRIESRYADYDSNTWLDETRFSYHGEMRSVYLFAQHTYGDKRNQYTTPLFPENRFHFALTELAAGPLLNLEGGAAFYLAPMLVSGSDRGTFNALEQNTGINGLRAGYRVQDFSLDFIATHLDGEGRRPYQPATDDLRETRKSRYYSLKAVFHRWRLELSNRRYTHTGEVTVTGPVYIAILGGAGPFENRREENKWQSAIGYRFRDDLSFKLDFYYTRRKDRQYSFAVHEYSEKGGQANISLRF